MARRKKGAKMARRKKGDQSPRANDTMEAKMARKKKGESPGAKDAVEAKMAWRKKGEISHLEPRTEWWPKRPGGGDLQKKGKVFLA